MSLQKKEIKKIQKKLEKIIGIHTMTNVIKLSITYVAMEKAVLLTAVQTFVFQYVESTNLVRILLIMEIRLTRHRCEAEENRYSA